MACPRRHGRSAEFLWPSLGGDTGEDGRQVDSSRQRTLDPRTPPSREKEIATRLRAVNPVTARSLVPRYLPCGGIWARHLGQTVRRERRGDMGEGAPTSSWDCRDNPDIHGPSAGNRAGDAPVAHTCGCRFACRPRAAGQRPGEATAHAPPTTDVASVHEPASPPGQEKKSKARPEGAGCSDGPQADKAV